MKENNNDNDTNVGSKGNSIEETIKQLELILKVRKELKDLIESGDLIIYRLRGLKHQGKGFIRIYKDARSGEENLGIDYYSLEQIEIIEILTHQQFEANCYEVGEEDE